MMVEHQDFVHLSIWAIIWKEGNILTPFLKCFKLPWPLPLSIGSLALLWEPRLVRRSCGWKRFWSLCWRRKAWRWRGRPSPLLKVSSLLTSPLIQERIRTLDWMVASLWCTIRRTGDASPLRCSLKRVFFLIKTFEASSSFTWGFSHLIWCINLAIGRKEIAWMHQRLHHGLQWGISLGIMQRLHQIPQSWSPFHWDFIFPPIYGVYINRFLHIFRHGFQFLILWEKQRVYGKHTLVSNPWSVSVS